MKRVTTSSPSAASPFLPASHLRGRESELGTRGELESLPPTHPAPGDLPEKRLDENLATRPRLSGEAPFLPSSSPQPPPGSCKMKLSPGARPLMVPFCDKPSTVPQLTCANGRPAAQWRYCLLLDLEQQLPLSALGDSGRCSGALICQCGLK